MSHSDSEDEVENTDVFGFDGRSSEADDMEEDLFEANEDADEGTEHGDVRKCSAFILMHHVVETRTFT